MKTLIALLALAVPQDDKEKLTKLLEEIRAQKAKLELIEQQILQQLGESKPGSQGKILNAPDAKGHLSVNLGKNQGIQQGDALKVSRDGKFVALLQVVMVEMDKSTCLLLAKALGEDVKAGDSVEGGMATRVVAMPNEEILRRVRELFKDADPNLVKDVEAGDKRALEASAPQMEYLLKLKESSPARFPVELELGLREVLAKQLSARYKEAAADQRKEVEAKLKKDLEAIFDARAKSRKLELDEIEQRLKTAKKTDATEDSGSKAKFVSQRLKELTKDQ